MPSVESPDHRRGPPGRGLRTDWGGQAVDAGDGLGYALGMAVEHLGIEALLGRLAAVRRAGDVIASDGDGTLWRGDIGEALFEAALAERALRAEAATALATEAERYGVEAAGDPNDTAARLYAAQRAGRYPDREAYAMMAWCFAGFALPELSEYVEGVLSRIRFEEAVRSFTPHLVAFAEEHDHPFWLVSASPLFIVRAAARRLRLAEERCLAMEPALEGERLLPRLASQPTYAEGKLRRLRERTNAPLLAGFGDSPYDAALMGAGRLAVAVAPKPELLAVLGETALVLEE